MTGRKDPTCRYINLVDWDSKGFKIPTKGTLDESYAEAQIHGDGIVMHEGF